MILKKKEGCGQPVREKVKKNSFRVRCRSLTLAVLKLILILALMCFPLIFGGCGRTDKTEHSGKSSAQQESDPALSEDDVFDIVLARIPGASKEDIVSFSLELEDGRWEYDGSIEYDGIEYEFEIDAQSGMILEWEMEK